MNYKFEDIADIRFGGWYKPAGKGKTLYLQVSNIDESQQLNQYQQPAYIKGKPKKGDLLQAGDILLPAKGSRLTAAVVSEEFADKAVASVSLFVIRIADKSVLPQYVQGFLNLPRTQWELGKNAAGTNMLSLSVKEVRDLNIEVPPVEIQQKIIGLRNLQQREAEILQLIRVKREMLVRAITQNILNN